MIIDQAAASFGDIGTTGFCYFVVVLLGSVVAATRLTGLTEELGFDEMKEFAAYYPGVYSYDDTSPNFHPWFPKYNEPYWKEYQEIVNLDEWEGVAGKPATRVARITYDYLANFDVRQANSAVAYIKQHAKDDKPFFTDVNFMKNDWKRIFGFDSP